MGYGNSKRCPSYFSHFGTSTAQEKIDWDGLYLLPNSLMVYTYYLHQLPRLKRSSCVGTLRPRHNARPREFSSKDFEKPCWCRSIYVSTYIYIYNYIYTYTQLYTYIYIYMYIYVICVVYVIYDVTRCHFLFFLFRPQVQGHGSKPKSDNHYTFDIHLNLSGAVGPTDRRNQGWEESDWVQVQGKLYWNTV